MIVLSDDETVTVLHALQSCLTSWRAPKVYRTQADMAYLSRRIREAEVLIQKLERPAPVPRGCGRCGAHFCGCEMGDC